MTRTATYLRYSSDRQKDTSTRDQMRNVANYCEREGWPAPSAYTDEAVSGSMLSREGYDQMLADADAGLFNILIVDDLSRLGRDMVEVTRVVKKFKFLGIRVVGVSDGVDTERKGYKVEVGLRGLMSELYLDDLAEKTHRGLTGQAIAGYSAGGLPYGYKSVHDGHGFKLVIDPDKAEWILFIYDQYAQGRSARAIAQLLNERRVPPPRGDSWVQSAIYGQASRGVGILNNPIYIGQRIWNRSQWVKDPSTGRRKRVERSEQQWIIQACPELRIIDQALYERVRARQAYVHRQTSQLRAKNPKSRGKRTPRYLLSGIMKCGICGGNYVMVNHYQYGCAVRKDRGLAVCSNSIRIDRQVAEEVLLREIREDLLSEFNFKAFERETRRLLKQNQPNPDAGRAELHKAQQEVDNIMTALRAGIITPTTKLALEQAEQRVAAAMERIKEFESYQPTQVLPRARERYRRLVENLSQIDDIALARESIKSTLGDIKLVPEDGILMAELKGGVAALSEICLVAGAGFESYLTVRRIPLKRSGL